MTDQARNNKIRKPYRKPKMKQVKLVPQEAVLGGCKISGVTQPGYADCQVGIEQCFAIAS